MNTLRHRVPWFFNYCSGYMDTVSGVSPLLLPKAKAGSLKSVKLLGATEQSGTPTPDAPVDIVSNNGVVKVSRNLFDKNQTCINAYVDTGTGGLTQGTVQYSFVIPCKPNTTYTLSGMTANSGWGAFSSNVIGTFSTTYHSGNGTITTGQNDKYLIGMAYATGTQYDYRDTLQVEEGATSTPYMQYGQIYTDGTQEKVQVIGKNLFNPVNVLNAYFDAGIGTRNILYYSASRTVYAAIQPNTQYTIYKSNSNRMRVGLSNSVTGAFELESIWYDTDGDLSPKTFTFTNTNYKYVLVVVSNNQVVPSDLQIELGSTATTYEPYFNGGTATAEMLLAISTFGKDVQEVLTGNITRNIGIKVLDGTENWQAHNTWYWADILPALSGEVSARLLCTHFVNQSPTNDLSIHRDTADSTYLQITYNAMADATALKTWLANQYANGTPVIVLYCIAPTTETVTGQPLQVVAGQNIAEITQASLDNLTLEAEYKRGR